VNVSHVATTIDPKLMKRLDELCKRSSPTLKQLSRAQVLRMIIKAGLEHYEQRKP